MRPCSACVAQGCLCVLSPLDDRYAQCVRTLRVCDLASPHAECQRLVTEAERLQDEALKAEAKASRLRRQRRALLKRLHSLDAREKVNIEELEQDEAWASLANPPELPSSSPAPGVSPGPAGFFQALPGSLNRTSSLLTSSS
jgi:type I site-specific restriction endonuclease